MFPVVQVKYVTRVYILCSKDKAAALATNLEERKSAVSQQTNGYLVTFVFVGGEEVPGHQGLLLDSSDSQLIFVCTSYHLPLFRL